MRAGRHCSKSQTCSHQHCKKLFIFCSVVKCKDGNQCYVCAETQSKNTCSKTITCSSLLPSCYTLAVSLSNGQMTYSKGCAPAKGFCGKDSALCQAALKAGAKACTNTCCSTSKCNDKFPDLNGGSNLVLGVKSMIVSVIVAFALL